MELIQVLEGELPHSDFFKEKGEGVHHLGFRVDDLEGRGFCPCFVRQFLARRNSHTWEPKKLAV